MMMRVIGRTIRVLRAPSNRHCHDKISGQYAIERYLGSLDQNRTGIVDALDLLKLQFDVDDNGIIKKAKFMSFEWLIGRKVDDLVHIKNTDIATHMKLSPMNLDHSILIKRAIESAISDHKKKYESPTSPTQEVANSSSGLNEDGKSTQRANGKDLSLTVGGMSYTVQESILSSYPNSFFGRMLAEEGRPHAPLVIDRDGALFRHVIDFMTYKCLPRNRELKCLLDNKTLVALLDEANYYQLTDLSQDIYELLYYPEKAVIECHEEFKSIISKYVQECTWKPKKGIMFNAVFESEVVGALQPFYVPSCIRGALWFGYDPDPIYKSSNTHNVNIEELLADATPSHFGRNSETVFDRSVRDSLEITAEHLNAETLNHFANRFPLNELSHTVILEARPYKLVIYPEGGHFAPHRDTVRGDNHVGTVVLILESKFTGGEFLVNSGGETMMVNEPGEWIAMFGDCMHEIRPVLSGVRVTLVYDIYCTGHRNLEKRKKDDNDEDDCDGYSFDDYEKDCNEVSARDMLCANSSFEDQHKKALIAACRNVASPFCITLQHLYPQSQSTMHFLKGGDRILFEALREHFDVQLVPIFCCYAHNDFDGSRNCYIVFGSINQEDQREVKHDRREESKSFPLFIPGRKLCDKHLIFRQDYVEFTGNHALEEQNAYLMRGLLVTPKV